VEAVRVYSGSPHEICKTVISQGKFVANLKKQSQFVGLRPEILSTKLEILNKTNGCGMVALKELLKVQFEKTNPICAGPNLRNVFCKRRLW